MSDPITTADTAVTAPAVSTDPAPAVSLVESTDTAPVTSEVSDTALTEPVVTADPEPIAEPEPIGIGTWLTYVDTYMTDAEPELFVVTNARVSGTYVSDLELTGATRVASLWDTSAIGRRTDGKGWQRADVSTGSGVTAVIIATAMRHRTAVTAHAETARKASADMETFRDRVREVAMEYAQRNDWCAEVARALAELGISVSRTVTVTGTFSVDMELDYGTDTPDASDVLEALSRYDLSIDDVSDED